MAKTRKSQNSKGRGQKAPPKVKGTKATSQLVLYKRERRRDFFQRSCGLLQHQDAA